MPAGGVPPAYAPYGAMGAYNYMMPPQMAVQVGAEAYGAAYGAYGAAAAAGNGHGGGDGASDYYGRRLGGGSAARGSQRNRRVRRGRCRTNPAAMDGLSLRRPEPSVPPPRRGVTLPVTPQPAIDRRAPARAQWLARFPPCRQRRRRGIPTWGTSYMTPACPRPRGAAVQSPYYGYPQANMYAAAGVYGQQSGASGGGGGKGGKGGDGRRAARRPTVQLLSAARAARAAEQWQRQRLIAVQLLRKLRSIRVRQVIERGRPVPHFFVRPIWDDVRLLTS